MDFHQIFEFSDLDAKLPLTSAAHTALPPLVSSSLFGPLKSEFWSSPDSPFTSNFDSDPCTKLSDSQEQFSSSVGQYCNFPLDGNSLFQLQTPSLDGGGAANPVDCSAQVSIRHDVNSGDNIKHALQKLETVLMGTDDEVTVPGTSYGKRLGSHVPKERSKERSGDRRSSYVYRTGHPVHHNQIEGIHVGSPQGSPGKNLKQLLVTCASALYENCMTDFNTLIEKAREVVSISGVPIQRLGAYLVEGLVAREQVSGTNIYRALKCREPAESKDLLSYMHILYEICPYLKFGYMAANGAIAEACRNEGRIHIIDFQIAQGTQWVTLLQALGARSGGPPHVRITVIDDPLSRYSHGGGIEAVGRWLKAISKKFNISVEFHVLPVHAPDITRDMVDVRPGEALAVNFPLHLHHILDESVDVNNPRDGILRMVKSLSPKVITLVEQESNTNTTPFLNRFMETMDYYRAIFESIDLVLPRNSKERINVEQHCLAKDIVNVIACEGKERIERHELFGKWKARLTMAGFKQCPLSSYVNSVIKRLLKCYSKNYTLVEKDGAMLLGWKERNLISASAWH